MQNAASDGVAHCRAKHGTLSITNGDDPSGWTQYNLAAPEKLLRAIVQRSGCFNLVDRAAGLNAATAERNIGSGLGLQRGSNVGVNQVKAADYVLVAEVQASNSNSGGNGMGAALGGLLGGRAGGIIGGIQTRKMEANTVLSLTNVRTTETVAVEEGYASKSDMSFGGGGGLGFGGGGLGVIGGGYENTDIGRIVTLAFINSYAKLVDTLEHSAAGAPGAQGSAERSPQRGFTTIAPATMRASPSAAGKVVRSLAPGMTVYPTGQKNGLWWEVADDNDNVGWVLNTKLEAAH